MEDAPENSKQLAAETKAHQVSRIIMPQTATIRVLGIE
jgi:hypothetical protein